MSSANRDTGKVGEPAAAMQILARRRMLLRIDMVLGYVAAAGVVGSGVCCAIGYGRAAFGCVLLCGCAWLLAMVAEAVGERWERQIMVRNPFSANNDLSGRR